MVEYTWIDYIVVAVVVGVGLMILYRALKEPLDLLFGFIKKGFLAIADKISGFGGESYDEISYG